MSALFQRTPHGYAATPEARATDARDAAIDRADRHADPGWKDAARLAVLRCLNRLDSFTTDDVWTELSRTCPSASTHEPRALGAVMQQMSREGLIEPTGEYRRSSSARCHARPKAVWRAKEAAC